MNTPLIIDNHDPKWVLLDYILKIFGSRRTKQELAKQDIKPTHKAGIMLKIILVAMFFSQDVSYVIRELKRTKKKENLRISIKSHLMDKSTASQEPFRKGFVQRTFRKSSQKRFDQPFSNRLNETSGLYDPSRISKRFQDLLPDLRRTKKKEDNEKRRYYNNG